MTRSSELCAVFNHCIDIEVGTIRCGAELTVRMQGSAAGYQPRERPYCLRTDFFSCTLVKSELNRRDTMWSERAGKIRK